MSLNKKQAMVTVDALKRLQKRYEDKIGLIADDTYGQILALSQTQNGLFLAVSISSLLLLVTYCQLLRLKTETTKQVKKELKDMEA